METLMTLIDEATEEKEQEINSDAVTTQSELEVLGFKKISNNILTNIKLKEKINNIAKYKYLKITEEMVHTYLDNKVKEYNKIHEESKTTSIIHGTPLYDSGMGDFHPFNTISYGYRFPVVFMGTVSPSIDNKKSKIIEIIKQTCDYYSREKGTIGKFVWKECPIEEYESIPPKEVLTKLRIHKDRLLFDYFTIASVENVKDPLLFGRINETTDKYFIAQWGEDILLDDLI